MKRKLTALLHGIRSANLIIAAGTMCISYFFLVIPLNELGVVPHGLSLVNFILLNLSVILIMAGGYIINDVYDLEVDLINCRPHNMQATFGRKTSMLLFYFLSAAGLLLGLWISISLTMIHLWTIHLLCFLLLCLYSTHLKSMPLLGNLTIAFLCGLIPIIPLIFDQGSYSLQFTPTYFIFNFLSIFAFLLTLMREITKDIEDMPGDRMGHHLTVPIIFGVPITKTIILVVTALLIILLIAVLVLSLGNDPFSSYYMTLAVILPIIVNSFLLYRADNSTAFHKVSSIYKLIMLSGLIYAILYSMYYL